MSIFRFECYLYGRLIFILPGTELMAFIRSYIVEQGLDIEISEWKTMKLIKKLYYIVTSYHKGAKRFREAVSQLLQTVLKTCRKEKKKTEEGYRKTPKQKIKK